MVIIVLNFLSPTVITHKFKAAEVNDQIVITGSFDVNIWYSYENDTKTTVITKTIEYNENVSVRQKESTDSSNKDIIVRSLRQPNCTSAKEDRKSIVLEIEKELGIEIVGDTKVKIAIEEEEEPWDIIDGEEYSSAIEKEIEAEIKEDFINETK